MVKEKQQMPPYFKLPCSIIMALFFCFTMPISAAFAASGIGYLSYTYGDVWIERQGTKQIAKRGETLFQQDIVVTGKRSRAKIMLHDKSRVYVGYHSRLELKKYRMRGAKLLSASINMFWGKAKFYVNKLGPTGSSFRVRTTTAVLGVRGTSFLVTQPVPDNLDDIQVQNLSSNFEVFREHVKLPTQVVLATGRVDLDIPGQPSISLTPGNTANINAKGIANVGKSSLAATSLDGDVLGDDDLGSTESADSPDTTVAPPVPESDADDGEPTANDEADSEAEAQSETDAAPEATENVAPSTPPTDNLAPDVTAPINNALQNLGITTDINIQPTFVRP